MTCQDVLEMVDAVAGGDVETTREIRAHLDTCPVCAAALASARRLELALAAREAPAAPAHFTAAVTTRIRRERWRFEQRVDRLFNVAAVAAVLLIASGSLALMNVRGVIAAAGTVWSLAGALTGPLAAKAAPILATYAAAAGLLVSVLGMWWWAERRMSL